MHGRSVNPIQVHMIGYECFGIHLPDRNRADKLVSRIAWLQLRTPLSPNIPRNLSPDGVVASKAQRTQRTQRTI